MHVCKVAKDIEALCMYVKLQMYIEALCMYVKLQMYIEALCMYVKLQMYEPPHGKTNNLHICMICYLKRATR